MDLKSTLPSQRKCPQSQSGLTVLWNEGTTVCGVSYGYNQSEMPGHVILVNKYRINADLPTLKMNNV